MPILSVFDLDHTLIRTNSSFSFGLTLPKRNLLDCPLFYSYWAFLLYQFRRLDMNALHRYAFDRILKGRHIDDITAHVELFLDSFLGKNGYLPALAELHKAQQNQHRVVLLSSSPSFLVRPIAKHLGIDTWYGTEYQLDSAGVLVEIQKIVDGEYKQQTVLKLASEWGVDRESIFAYSDSITDLVFLEASGHPCGVNPDRQLRKICMSRGWKIL